MATRTLRAITLMTLLCALAGSSEAQDKKEDKIVLPDLQTDDGALVRLLLVESRNPGYSDYDEAKALAGMKVMKAVVDNRLNHIPTGYKLKDFVAEGATNYRDIITAKKQFAGFSKSSEGEVVITTGLEKNINEILMKANTGAPGKYHKFCKNALKVVADGPEDQFTG